VGPDTCSRLVAHRDRDPRALLDVVFEEVRRFADGEQGDDQTMVIASSVRPYAGAKPRPW